MRTTEVPRSPFYHMRESQIHDAFMVWLKRQGLLYVHSTFGKKATMTKDMPDFIILHAGRALLVECKTEKGLLTHGQMEKFTEIKRNSGMAVQIARTVEQCVSAVTTWLGVESAGIEARASVRHTSQFITEPIPAPDPEKNLFIGRVGDQRYVFEGSGKPGTPAKMIRAASPSDLVNLPLTGKLENKS